MVDRLNGYAFDFMQEVSDLCDSLGPRAARIIFLEAQVAPDKVNFLQAAAGDETFLKDYVRSVAEFITSYYNAAPGSSSHAFGFEAENREGCAIVLRQNEPVAEGLGAVNTPLMRLFSLYHETGHALMPMQVEGDLNPLPECAGDAYAALRLLQRFGNEACGFLSLVSWMRSFHGSMGSIDHLTTTVLDKIISDSPREDFTALTAEQMLTRARQYAEDWAPDGAMVAAAAPVFSPGGSIDFYGLAQTALTSPNNFIFYVGAKVLQPFLGPEGVVFNGHEQHMPEDVRDEIRGAIEHRLQGKGLRSVFNTPAARADVKALDTLKVSYPPGQKQLTFKV